VAPRTLLARGTTGGTRGTTYTGQKGAEGAPVKQVLLPLQGCWEAPRTRGRRARRERR
jgi:hypothetical protein